MERSTLEAALTKKQREAGLSLKEVGDDELYLMRGGALLALFSQYGATVVSIREEADRWISRSKNL